MNSDPLYYPESVTVGDHIVQLTDLVEICQGGPRIGKLVIDGRPFHSDLWFGGPMISTGEMLCLTVRAKTLLFNGFRIGIVDPSRMTLIDPGVKGTVIWLARWLNGRLYYRRSLDPICAEESIGVAATDVDR